MAREERQYVAADLYGADGRPHAEDVDQDDIFNCYFVAPLGALGEYQPDRISDAIRFNADTGDFTVTLYRPPNARERSEGQTDPIRESIDVSQEDIRNNIRRDGGGTVDNNRDRNGPLWPTVLEAGFAELYGRDQQGRVNLGDGYEVIGSVTRGGSLSDGMYALTGESGRSLRIQSPDAPRLQATGPNYVNRPEPPPFQAPFRADTLVVGEAYAQVEQALAAGRPVSMSTQGRDVRDGLEESHAYMVVGVSRDPQTNEPLVTLRNPYGNNERAGEGNHNVGAGWNDSNPEITVRLSDLVKKGSFGEFNIGPAPRVQTQQQGPQPTVPEQPAVPTPNPQALLNDPAHPDNGLYQQVLAQTMKLPRDGRVSGEADKTDQQLSAALAVRCREAGMDCVNHVVLSKDGSRAFAVDTPDIRREWRNRADVDVADAIRQPLDASTERMAQVNQELSRQGELERQQLRERGSDDPSRGGPVMG